MGLIREPLVVAVRRGRRAAKLAGQSCGGGGDLVYVACSPQGGQQRLAWTVRRRRASVAGRRRRTFAAPQTINRDAASVLIQSEEPLPPLRCSAAVAQVRQSQPMRLAGGAGAQPVQCWLLIHLLGLRARDQCHRVPLAAAGPRRRRIS